MNLDLLTAFATLIMAGCVLMLHIITSRHNVLWPDLPGYVRGGMFVIGLGLTYRGIELLGLSRPRASAIVRGHVDLVGLGVALAMTYTLLALVWFAMREIGVNPLHARLRRRRPEPIIFGRH